MLGDNGGVTGPQDSSPAPEGEGAPRVPPPYPLRFGADAGGVGDDTGPDQHDIEPTRALQRPIWDQDPDPSPAEEGPAEQAEPPRPGTGWSAPPGASGRAEDYGYYGGFGKHGPPAVPPAVPPPAGPVAPPAPPAQPAATGWPGAEAWHSANPAGEWPGPGWTAGQASGPAPRPARVPGWLWPVVAVVALLTGLVGGAVGGALVSGEDQPEVAATDTVLVPQGSPAPLPAGNASIAAVADKVLPSTVQVLARGGAGTVGGGTGSGFVVDRRGHVITNNHVVARATEDGDLVVVDHRGRRYAARIVGRSPVYDIAVLSVERGRRLAPAVAGAAAALRIGDTVVAIGSPLGLSSTVTSGIVSAVNRPVTTGSSDASSYINAVQTDAAINPGNSGGPLVNLRGQVVGVNSAIATTGGLTGEAGSIGVGFAIPMEQVRVTANQILATGKAEYPVIGANVDTERSGSGATVMEVPDGTPAETAGLREGDVVVAVEGQRVTDGIGLIVAIRSHRPGETITLTVRRDGRQRDVAVRLDSKVG